MKILIELPTWMGDSVMATPAIENLSKYYKDPQITLIGSFVSVEVLKNQPKVIKTHVLNKAYISLYKTTKHLGEFDVFFSFRGSYRSKFLKFFISSQYKYQFNKDKYHNYHLVEQYNNFINDSLKTDLPAGRLTIFRNSINSKSIKVEESFLQLLDTRNSKLTLGLNPGAKYGSAKRWDPLKYAQVAAELSDKFNIFIFGGPNESDIAYDIEKSLIKMGITNYKNLAEKTTITELIQYISQLDLFITGDSGPMHIAASFQVPTIAIFGPTDDKETAQWMNEKSTTIKKNLECQPCMKRKCPLGHHNCMKLIKADDVLKTIINHEISYLQIKI